MRDENYQKLRDYALRLLSFRPRSTKEMQVKLQKYSAKKRFPDALIDSVLEGLVQQKFLDDKEFVRWWVEQRQSYKPKGLKAIKLELLYKGIDKEMIERVFSEKSEDNISEYDLAMRIIGRKIASWKGLSRERLKIKARDVLLRRGFDWDTIRKVIDSLVKKSYNTV